MEIRSIETEKIDVVPGRNPRLIFSPGYIESLGQSLLTDGQETPIVVLRRGERFELIHGENRLRAARLKRIRTLTAKVFNALSEPEIICKALKPNLAQSKLGLLEVALKVVELKNCSGWSHGRIAQQLCWSQRWVTDRIRIAEGLTPNIRRLISTSCLKHTQARLLTKLPLEEQDGAAIEIMRRRMTGKQTALYVAQLLGNRLGVGSDATRLITESKHLLLILHVVADSCCTKLASISENSLSEIGDIYHLLVRLLGKISAIVHRSDAQKANAQKANGENKGVSE